MKETEVELGNSSSDSSVSLFYLSGSGKLPSHLSPPAPSPLPFSRSTPPCTKASGVGFPEGVRDPQRTGHLSLNHRDPMPCRHSDGIAFQCIPPAGILAYPSDITEQGPFIKEEKALARRFHGIPLCQVRRICCPLCSLGRPVISCCRLGSSKYGVWICIVNPICQNGISRG